MFFACGQVFMQRASQKRLGSQLLLQGMRLGHLPLRIEPLREREEEIRGNISLEK